MLESAASATEPEVGLDEETIAAINEAESRDDLGEGMNLDSFRAEMKKRFKAR